MLFLEMSDHNDCRKKVCVVCIRKATKDRKLSDVLIKAIKDYVNPNYDVNDPDYPCGLCTSCYIY